MSFIGKIACLVVFPGALSLALVGVAARWGLSTVTAALREPAAVPHPGIRNIIERLTSGQLTRSPEGAVQWIAPPARLFAVSWAACILTGFLDGDIVLVYSLMLLALASPLVIEDGRGQIELVSPGGAAIIGCAVTMALALGGASLRTGEVEVARIIEWQVTNGMLVASPSGGTLAIAGSLLCFAGALIASLALMGIGPFRDAGAERSTMSAQGAIGEPARVALQASNLTMLVTAPLLVVAVFLAGGASSWYEIVFWSLKMAGVIVFSGVLAALFTRYGPRHGTVVLSVSGFLAALAGFVILWIGGSP